MNRMYWSRLVVWTVFSLATSVFCGFVGYIAVAILTMDKHSRSTAPGDYQAVPRPVITQDIAVHCGGVLLAEGLVLLAAYAITLDLLKELPPQVHRRPIARFTYGLLWLNAVLLAAGPLLGGLLYWKAHAPYFNG